MRLISFRKKSRHVSKRRSHKKSRSHKVAKRRRSYRRNPSDALKRIMSPSNFIQIAAVTLGFIGGAKGGAIMYDKLFSGSSALAKVRRFAGLATFAIATFAATKIKNPTLKVATSGVAAAGIYDLIAQNFAAAGLKPVSGDVIDLEGVDLVGEGDVYAGDSVDVSGDMTELVGDDSDRIYG